MNCAVLFQSLLPIPDLPPQIIPIKHRLFLVLSALVFFFAIPYSAYTLGLILFSASDWVFLGAFLQHIPNFSFSFLLFLVSWVLLSGTAGAKQNGQPGISSSDRLSERRKRDGMPKYVIKANPNSCLPRVQATNKEIRGPSQELNAQA